MPFGALFATVFASRQQDIGKILALMTNQDNDNNTTDEMMVLREKTLLDKAAGPATTITSLRDRINLFGADET